MTYQLDGFGISATVPYTEGKSSLEFVLVYQDTNTAFMLSVNGNHIYALYGGNVEDITFAGAVSSSVSESQNGLEVRIDDGAGTPFFPPGPVSIALVLK